MRCFRSPSPALAWGLLAGPLVALLVSAGCVGTGTRPCDFGQICPADKVCYTAEVPCVDPGQLLACVDATPLSSCAYEGAPPGEHFCLDGLCVPSRCGDGVLFPDEVCDDGNTIDGDGCSAECDSDETCGNGLWDTAAGEACDDGNLRSRDGCSSGCTAEVPVWTNLGMRFTPRFGALAAYDPGRGRSVIFGGCDGYAYPFQDLLEFDGVAWRRVITAVQPPIRYDGGAAFDTLLGAMVIHGGWAGTLALDDTWLYDGVNWRYLSTATAPPARSGQGMTWVEHLGLSLMFGGEQADRTPFGDTWTFDGDDWSKLFPSGAPSPRRYPSLAYDPLRERVVLFGGSDGLSPWNFYDDTWEWDGQDWVEVDHAVRPPPRHGGGFVWDPLGGRLVLVGGLENSPTPRSDVWVYDGVAWQELPTSNDPSPRGQSSLTLSPTGHPLLVGGHLGNYSALSEVYRLVGSAWEPLGDGLPTARMGHAVALDTTRRQVLLFGGSADLEWTKPLDDTYTLENGRWLRRAPATSPPPRFGHALADAPDHAAVWLFGGATAWAGDLPTGCHGDLWRWDGRTWQEQPAVGGPSPRVFAAVAFHRGSGLLLVDGGVDGLGLLGGTWRFDGEEWSEEPSPDAPSPRSLHAMAYDPTRDRVVLFGGQDGDGPLEDTWEHDGVAWSRLSPQVAPPARSSHYLAWHPERGRVLLYGGWSSGQSLYDAWEWNGAQWTRLLDSAPPQAWRLSGAAFDPQGRQLVMFGGAGSPETLSGDTWTLTFQGGWPDEVCGDTLDADGDGLVSCADPDCEGAVCAGGRCRGGACEPSP